MFHYFIINPQAGNQNVEPELRNKIIQIFKNKTSSSEHFEIYCTTSINDATLQIKKVCQNRKEEIIKNEHIRFYACGGDGTCFECLNGIVNFDNVSFAIVPIGSCNDFLKTYPEHDFSNLENLINGEAIPIDILKVNDCYSLNVCNIGYDAKVNADCMSCRDKYKTIKKAYHHALIVNLLKPLGDAVIVKTINDDNQEEVFFNGKSLLLAIGNGQYYGGGFRCTPYASPTDGLLEIAIIKKVSVLTFLTLVKGYKKGYHIMKPKKYKKVAFYRQAKKVIIESLDELAVCIDGENFFMKKITIEVLPKKLNFVFPK